MNYEEAKQYIYYGNDDKALTQEEMNLLQGFLSRGKINRVVDFIKDITECDDVSAKALAFDLQEVFPAVMPSTEPHKLYYHECEKCHCQTFEIIVTPKGTVGICSDCGHTIVINNQKSSHYIDSKGQIHCPKCFSTSITTSARGMNFTMGLIGASKTVNRCSNCGHTWKPKK